MLLPRTCFIKIVPSFFFLLLQWILHFFFFIFFLEFIFLLSIGSTFYACKRKGKSKIRTQIPIQFSVKKENKIKLTGKLKKPHKFCGTYRQLSCFYSIRRYFKIYVRIHFNFLDTSNYFFLCMYASAKSLFFFLFVYLLVCLSVVCQYVGCVLYDNRRENICFKFCVRQPTADSCMDWRRFEH